jgi:hypothetical protein
MTLKRPVLREEHQIWRTDGRRFVEREIIAVAPEQS